MSKTSFERRHQRGADRVGLLADDRRDLLPYRRLQPVRTVVYARPRTAGSGGACTKSLLNVVYCSNSLAISSPRGCPMALALSHAVPMAFASASVARTPLVETLAGEVERQRQHECQQGEQTSHQNPDPLAGGVAILQACRRPTSSRASCAASRAMNKRAPKARTLQTAILSRTIIADIPQRSGGSSGPMLLQLERDRRNRAPFRTAVSRVQAAKSALPAVSSRDE